MHSGITDDDYPFNAISKVFLNTLIAPVLYPPNRTILSFSVSSADPK